jgi:class 3 adenylate cyclase/tetratricopeptide (TPR) repeat protein
VRKIAISRLAMEGERKHVTVLFADLKSSLELLVDRDPEEARRILDPLLQSLMEGVHHYEGTVNQVMGDGIMALFGAPVAHEDHAVRACYAALRIQDNVGRLGREIAAGPPPQVRIGLNSGEVVVRSIASDLHMDYSAVGQTTHLASRMEQMARPGSVLLAPETVRLAQGFIDVAPLGPMTVKGLATPLPVFELLGALSSPSRLKVAAARGRTLFVGRECEQAALRRALAKARAGQGQVVALVGQPGVGKSRLVREFTHSADVEGWLVLEAAGVSVGRGSAYLPVIDLLRIFFQIDPQDDARAVGDKVSARLGRLGEPAAIALPLLVLLGAVSDEPRWTALEPAQRRHRTLEAVQRILIRASQMSPLVVVVEDLHWVDSETEGVLHRLVDDLSAATILLLVTYRPEYGHQGDAGAHHTQLKIDPLSRESSHALFHSLLGSDETVRPLRDTLIDRTEGNPFFMEETVRTLVDTGALVGERGAYRLVRPLASSQVPPTVQTIIAARIDRRPPIEKYLLQTAAVVGKDVPLDLLAQVADLPADDLHQALDNLRRAEFLYERSLFPEIELTFTHALIHEVAYWSLLRERRKSLHARIVEGMERLNTGRRAESDRIADHALLGEVWDKGATYCRQAGERAFSRSAHREAVVRFEQAIEALTHLPERGEALAQAVDVRFELRHSLLALGQHGRVLACLRDARRLATALGDPRRMAWLLCYETIHFWTIGDPDAADEAGQRALALAEDLGDVALLAVANLGLGWTSFARGDYPRAIHQLGQTVRHLEGALSLQRFGLAALPAVGARTYLAFAHAELGEFAAGRAVGAEAISIAESLQDPWSRASAYYGAGVVDLRQGEPAVAIPGLERGLALCREFGIRTWLIGLASALGYAYGLSGETSRAVLLGTEAVAEAEATNMRLRHSLRVAWLAEIHLLADHGDEAGRLAGRALELARAHKERGHEAHILRILADVGARRDADPAKAEAGFARALTLAETLGMRPLMAQCHEGLGRGRSMAGDIAGARRALDLAASLYRALDMPGPAARVDRARRALGADLRSGSPPDPAGC